MSGGFLVDGIGGSGAFDNLGVQGNDGLAFAPFEIEVLAPHGRAHPGLRLAEAFADLYLRQTGRADFGEE